MVLRISREWKWIDCVPLSHIYSMLMMLPSSIELIYLMQGTSFGCSRLFVLGPYNPSIGVSLVYTLVNILLLWLKLASVDYLTWVSVTIRIYILVTPFVSHLLSWVLSLELLIDSKRRFQDGEEGWFRKLTVLLSLKVLLKFAPNILCRLSYGLNLSLSRWINLFMTSFGVSSLWTTDIFNYDHGTVFVLQNLEGDLACKNSTISTKILWLNLDGS